MHFWPPEIDQIAYRGITPARAMFRQSRGVQEVLRAFKARDPNRAVVIVHEAWFRGVVPMLLDASNMLKAPVLAIGVPPFTECLRGGTFGWQVPSPVGSEYEGSAIDCVRCFSSNKDNHKLY
jgi:hypothetical protein